jgi:YcxB-like protein
MSIGQAFQIDCTVTEQDHVSAAFLHMHPRRGVGIVGILLVTLFLIALALSFRDMLQGSGGSPFWVLSAVGVYFLVYFFFWLPRGVKRLYRQARSEGKVTFAINADGFGIRSERGEAEIPWPHFHKWKQDKKSVLLYQNDAFYLILPKRCFTAEQLQTLLHFLGQHVRQAL